MLSRCPWSAALLLTFACAAASAGEKPEAPPLSFASALERTRATSPALRAFVFQLQAADARQTQTSLRPAPEVQFQLENFAGDGKVRGLRAAEWSLALSQVIELGGQGQRRAEWGQARRSELDLEQSILQLDAVAELGRRFIHVASDQEHLRLTEEALSLARSTEAEVQRRVDAARSPDAELYRARIARSRAELEHEHAEHELLSSRRQLAALWGSREADFGPVEAPLSQLPAPGDFDALVPRLSSSPDFLRYANQTRQREAEVRWLEAKARGNLTLSGGLRRLQATQETAFIAGFSLLLGSGPQTAPALAEARAQQTGIAAEQHAAQIKAEATLFELVQELRHALTEAQQLRDDLLPAMDAALKATKYAWQRGRYSYLEWSDAQQEHLALRRAWVDACAEAQRLQIEIQRLTGQSLSP